MLAVAWGLVAGAAGELDPTFGSGGMVVPPTPGTFGLSYTVVLQPDGRIVVGGSGNGGDFSLSRFHPDGSVDPTFGTGGTTFTDFAGGQDRVHALLLLPDGKLVAAGQSDFPSSISGQFGLARYTADGALDATFGVGGKVRTAFPPGSVARAMVQLPDGRLLVAGRTRVASGTQVAIGLAQFLADGTPDPTFGTGGMRIVDLPTHDETAEALVLLPDGRFVTVGLAVATAGALNDVVLARFHPDGVLDATFGAGGGFVVDDSIAGKEEATSLLALPDGKLLVVGSVDEVASTGSEWLLVRFDADGARDPGFGVAGVVTTDFLGAYDAAEDVVLQPDGKLLVVGRANHVAPRVDTDVALARYLPDGTLDVGFGTGGKVTTEFSLRPDGFRAAALQPDGRLVAVGDGLEDAARPLMARYLTGPDVTPPRVFCAPSAPTFLLRASGVVVTATVEDSESGPLTPVVSGPASTGAVGLQDVLVTGTDRAGNTASVRCAYRVVYAFAGEASGWDVPGRVERAEAGALLPLFWRLTDAHGVPVHVGTDEVSLRLSSRPCELGTRPDLPVRGAFGLGVMSLGGGLHLFPWRPQNALAGACKTLTLELGDGVPHTLQVDFPR